MKVSPRTLLFCLSTLIISSSALAIEPAYCQPDNFFDKEFDPHESIWRDHAFKFGDVILVGGAIGKSNSNKVSEFALDYSTATEADKYCVWYYNEGNEHAAEKFNHFYVSNPKGLTTTSGPKEYREVLKDQFTKAPTSFLSCLEKHKFLTMGCDGQMHRGPTVFGMLLSFSGCSSKHSLDIVNELWGKHGVKPEVRQAIIEVGYQLGNEDPAGRARMQKVLGY